MATVITRRGLAMGTLGLGGLAMAGRISAATAATDPAASGVTLVQLVVRNQSLSHQDFVQAWTGLLASRASGIPGLLGCSADDVMPGPPRADISVLPISAQIDGIAEYRFDSRDAAATGLQSAAGGA